MHLRNLFSQYKPDGYKVIGVMIAVFLVFTIRAPQNIPTDPILQIDYLEELTDLEHSVNAEVTDMLALILAIEDADLGYPTVSNIPSPSPSLPVPAPSPSPSVSPSVSLSSSAAPAPSPSPSMPRTFEALCDSDAELCEKAEFNGKFSDTELYVYFKQFQFLVNEIDTAAKRGENVRKVLKNLILNQTKGSRRGSAGRDKITINLGGLIYDHEYFQVLSHEMGHIVDLGSLQGKSRTKNATFTEFGKVVFAIDDPSLEYYRYSRQSETIRKSWVKRQDFCSGYGMTNPFEDFAECHNLYLNHHNIFRSLATTNDMLKNKYNYLANLYGGNFLSNSVLSTNAIQTDRRAWDTTRIEE